MIHADFLVVVHPFVYFCGHYLVISNQAFDIPANSNFLIWFANRIKLIPLKKIRIPAAKREVFSFINAVAKITTDPMAIRTPTIILKTMSVRLTFLL